jgi:hypothetical protein
MRALVKVAGMVIMAAALSTAASAAQWKGVLIDKHCEAGLAKSGMKAVQAHSRSCALMPGCAKSGYGVYTSSGKFIPFDAAGNQKALAALKASTKKDNLQVVVNGTQRKGAIHVSSLKLM